VAFVTPVPAMPGLIKVALRKAIHAGSQMCGSAFFMKREGGGLML